MQPTWHLVLQGGPYISGQSVHSYSVAKLEQSQLGKGQTMVIFVMIPGALLTINLKNNYINPLLKIVLNHK